jgi:Predicted dehydrogenases and related proteins
VTVNVGVIGAGMIGQDHIRRLTYVLSGARVTAVTDVDLDRAKSAVERLSGVQVHETGQDLISDPGVDAIIVASWGPTHEEYVLAGIAAGKQVFCEKPLATTREACERILDAEVAAGRRLVMVGFMRRYDDGYRAMKEALDRGDIGAPLVFHSAHRNPSVPPSVTTDGVIVDTCVHDIDIARFLLGSEVVAAQVFNPRRSSLAAEQLQDPLLLLLEMANGVLVDVEAAVNIVYGYDIRGEILGETGTVELAENSRSSSSARGNTRAGSPPTGGNASCGPTTPNSRNGSTRSLPARRPARAHGTGTPRPWSPTPGARLRTGQRVTVSMREQPDLYRVATGSGTGTD